MTEPRLKRKLLTYAAILMGVCLVSALALSSLFVLSRDSIRENEEAAFREKLTDVLGDAENPRGIIEYADTVPLEDRVYVADLPTRVRYAAMGSAQGYQSVIRVLLSLDAPRAREPVEGDPRIVRLSVVSSGETPGLGENIHKVPAEDSLWGAAWKAVGGGEPASGEKRRPAFQEQFSGKRLSDLVIMDKAPDGAGMVPITGATITSRAVVKAARRAVERIIEQTSETYGPEE